MMPKYLITANYTEAGLKGLMKDGATSRVAAINALAAGVGGSVESVYYGFGDNDVFIIGDMPNNEAAAAIALTAGASGAATTTTTVLLEPSQVDAAIAMSPAYTPPGA